MKTFIRARWFLIGLLVSVGVAVTGSVIDPVPYTFTNGTVADADQVNANFVAVKDAVNDNAAKIAALQTAVDITTPYGTRITELEEVVSNIASAIVGTWRIKSWNPTMSYHGWNKLPPPDSFQDGIATFTAGGEIQINPGYTVSVVGGYVYWDVDAIQPLGLVGCKKDDTILPTPYPHSPWRVPTGDWFIVTTSASYRVRGNLVSVTATGVTDPVGGGMILTDYTTFANVYYVDENMLLMVPIFSFIGGEANAYLMVRQ